MNDYRYTLEKGSRKHLCPACGKKTFVRYIDTDTGNYLPEQYGRCDREDNCRYHVNPYEDNFYKNQYLKDYKIPYESIEKVDSIYSWEKINKQYDEVLKEWSKPATAERNMKAVKAFRDNGNPVHGMMMVGGEEDTPESLDYTVDWCKKNLDSVQFFAPIPLPGTPFWDRMNEQNRIIADRLPHDYHLYDGQYVVLQPNNFTPLELQTKIFDMYKQFYGIKGNIINILKSPRPLEKGGVHAYAPRIVKSVENDPQTTDYMERLRNLE